jgi:signal transduction histidine kinase
MSTADPSTPPVLADDDARVEALRALHLLEGIPDERFDRITRLATRLFDVPIAMVNLVDREEQRGLSCLGLPSSDMPRAQSFCAHAIARPEPLVVPDVLNDARFAGNHLVTGSTAWRFYAGHPLAAPSGHRIGTLCIADTRPRAMSEEDLAALRDLALLVEREVAEARLEEALQGRRIAEARLRAVVDSAAEGIVTTGSDATVEYANPAAGRILGFGLTDVVGRPAADVISGWDGEPGGGAAEWARRGGEGVVPVEYTTAAIGADAGRVVVFRDVSDRRALEQLREGFLASVSHDLRTPLATATGYLELLLDGLAGELAEDQRTYLDTVARSVQRLRGHIEDLLLTAELDDGARPPALAPLDLAELAAEVERELDHAARDRGVELRLDAAPAPVSGDGGRLRRAIAAVVGNAVKYSRPGGEVTLRVFPADGGGAVEVRDDGPGIPAAELPYVTQRFFRASTAGTASGSGLGLAIAREIAEQHGGRIELESGEGAGTTARLWVPARPAAA